MPIRLEREGVSAVYGIVDIGAELADVELAKTNPNIAKSFMNVTDISRTVATLGGVAAKYYARNPRWQEVGETVAVASIPLFEKSLYKAVRKWMGVTTQGQRAGMTLTQRSVGAPIVQAPLGEGVF